MRCIFLAVLFSISVPALAQTDAQRSYEGPIIDMHLHARSVLLRTAEGVPIPRGCNPQPCDSVPAQVQEDGDYLRHTLAAMERNNIVLGFLSSAESLGETYRWQKAAPGRFIASPSVGDPDLIDLNDLRKEYESGRLGGMGELGIQYAGIAVGDSRVTPFFALAEEFDVPVLIHHHGTGGPSDQFRISLGHPELLEQILVERPNLYIFIETSGFPYLEETIALMYRYRNVYGDLSLGKYPPRMADKYLRDLVDAGLGKRIMFASDQGLWPERIDETIDMVDSAEYLSDDQKQDIFYNNAARFLRLSEDEIAKHHRR
jgi:predicted TIM-barrel fold metal-dependent hydrolase